jgi:hypothetical protein
MVRDLPLSHENNGESEYGAVPGSPVRHPNGDPVPLTVAQKARMVRTAGMEPEFIAGDAAGDVAVPGTRGDGKPTVAAQQLADFHTAVNRNRRRRLNEHTNGYIEEVDRIANE